MRGLEGKVAIVTGGGQGIGRALTLRLAEEGCKVAIFDLKPEAGEETATLAKAGATVKTYAVDVGDYDAVAIVTAKDHVQASAVAFALLGRARLQLRGQPVKTFKSVKTTPLLDPDQNETEEAFELAGQYKPS